MRGTKLTAWRVPQIWEDLQNGVLSVPENSHVIKRQKKLMAAAEAALNAVAADVRGGLLETVGVESTLSMDGGRCSMVLELPAGTDAERIARAIDLENIEAWTDANGKVHLAISPWYSTKDVDQTVLSAVKVVHVLLGIHAGDNPQPKTFKQKLLASIAEIMKVQESAKKKD